MPPISRMLIQIRAIRFSSLFAIAIATAIASASCGGSPTAESADARGREDAITGGAIDETHVNVGAVVVDLRESANYSQYGITENCTGTLIHPRVFLTAGHCMLAPERYGIGLDKIWVTYDGYALNSSTWHAVEARILDPNYRYDWSLQDKADIGMWILKEPVMGIKPARLATPGYLDALLKKGLVGTGTGKKSFTHVGYGYTIDDHPGDFVDNQYRLSVSSWFSALEPYWLQTIAQTQKQSGGTCYGDSGGPTIWTEDDGSEVVVALVSMGDPDCLETSIDYRIDLQSSVDFIQSVLASM